MGNDQLLLAVFFVIWPCGSADECAAFIFNEGGDLYSRSEISHRLRELHVTRKVSSTEAYQAFLPINRLKLQMFFTMPPPFGILGVPRRKFIDVDEFGISNAAITNMGSLCPVTVSERQDTKSVTLSSLFFLLLSHQAILVCLHHSEEVWKTREDGFVFYKQQEQLYWHSIVLLNTS